MCREPYKSPIVNKIILFNDGFTDFTDINLTVDHILI